MSFQWTPISPALDENGAFACLTHLPDADTYKPVPESEAVGERFGQGRGIEDDTSVSTMAKLGLAGVANVYSEFSSRAVYRDVARWHEAELPLGETGPIMNTRWGAGFRLTLTVTEVSAGVNTSLPWIAAAVELGLANASYELRTFGFSDPSLFKNMPVSGRFDQETLDRLRDAEEQVRAYLANETDALTALPFQVLMDTDLLPADDPLDDARAALLAARAVSDGRSLDDVRARAADHALPVSAVERFYTSMQSEDDPREAAERWLDRAGL